MVDLLQDVIAGHHGLVAHQYLFVQLGEVALVFAHQLFEYGLFLGLVLLSLVPVIDLKGYEYPDHHQYDLPKGVKHVFTQAVLG